MQISELCKLIIHSLEDSKAKDIKVLDVQALTDTTDKLIICSGTSGRHVASLAKSMQDDISAAGILPLSSEGEDEMKWILVDYVHVVVHVMRNEVRNYYDLESLWDTRLAKATPRAKLEKIKEEELQTLSA